MNWKVRSRLLCRAVLSQRAGDDVARCIAPLLPVCCVTAAPPGTRRPLCGPALWARCRPWRGRNRSTPSFRDILRLVLGLLAQRGKTWGATPPPPPQPRASELRKSTSASCCTAPDRCTETASPQNTPHPQVGLINLERHCWSNKPEVAVWLSLFSVERSVSTKHCQSWRQPWEAASNPVEEFNPCRLTWVSAPQWRPPRCVRISGELTWTARVTSLTRPAGHVWLHAGTKRPDYCADLS